MITDILTIGPGIAPDGGDETGYTQGSTTAARGSNWFEIDPTHTQDAINAAVAEIKSGMSAFDGADIYIWPSSTGQYVFDDWAIIDIPVRIHCPAGTVFKNDDDAATAAARRKMFAFVGASTKGPGSGIFGMRAQCTVVESDTKLVIVEGTTNAESGANHDFRLEGCTFEITTDPASTALTSCACVWIEGEDYGWDYTVGPPATTLVMDSGIRITNNSFRFDCVQQTVAWTNATEPAPYGMQGVYALNAGALTISNNVFVGLDSAYASDDYGYFGGALTLDNCIFAVVTGNRAIGLSTEAAGEDANGRYASDIFRAFTDGADAAEGHHSIWGHNWIEQVTCRYAYCFESSIYNVIAVNGLGRAKCAAGFYIGPNADLGNGGQCNLLSLCNPHNILPSPGTAAFTAYPIQYNDTSTVLHGPHLYAVGDTSRGQAKFTTSGGITVVPFDAVQSTFVNP